MKATLPRPNLRHVPQGRAAQSIFQYHEHVETTNRVYLFRQKAKGQLKYAAFTNGRLTYLKDAK